MSLYKATEAFVNVIRRIQHNDEELTEDLEIELDVACGNFEDRARGVGFALWDAEKLLNEEKRILEMVKARFDRKKRAVARLSGYLGRMLHNANRTVEAAVGGVPCTWGAKEKGDTVIPEHYYEHPGRLPKRCILGQHMVYDIDKRLVRKLLDGKETIAGKKWVPIDGIHVRRTYTAKAT